MDILYSQNKRISQLSDFLCEAMDLLKNLHTKTARVLLLLEFHKKSTQNTIGKLILK